MRCFKPYDVFISYAAEDKEAVADPLFKKLKASGLHVWYAADRLIQGEYITNAVDKAIKSSRIGIVVLSKPYHSSQWANHELYAICTRKNENQMTMLAVWHGISSDEIRTFFPGVELLDIFSLSTRNGVEPVIDKLVKEIDRKRGICGWISFLARCYINNKAAVLGLIATSLIIMCGVWVVSFINSFYPPESLIKAEINRRIKEACVPVEGLDPNCKKTEPWELTRLRQEFENRDDIVLSQHRATFSVGNKFIESKAELSRLGVLSYISSQSDGFSNYTICVTPNDRAANKIHYRFANSDPVDFEIEDRELYDLTEYRVTVTYTNFIRFIDTECTIENGVKYDEIVYRGMMPTEEFIFERKGNRWEFVTVNEIHYKKSRDR